MLYFRSKVCRFVILFEGRTGSTYFIEHLNSHPNIRALGEVLVESRKQHSQAQLQMARDVLRPPILGRWAAIGFKTKLRDIVSPKDFASMLKEFNMRVIYMVRTNQVKAVISTINAWKLKQMTNDYNLYKTTDRLPATTIDLNEFQHELTRRQNADNQLQAFINHLELPTLKITYENFLSNESRVMADTLNFLKVPFKPTRGRALKITNDDLRSVIINFDELRSHYFDTPYESMFDEKVIT